MLTKLYSYCIQGDVQEAYRYLQSVEQTKKVQVLKTKYYNRFFREKPILRIKSKDIWIKQVIRAYYHYFINVLAKREPHEAAEKKLLQELIQCLPNSFEDGANIDQVEEELKAIFENKGYHFLGGITAPFRGPYIWKRTEKHVYQVELPYSVQEVTVYFMYDFLLLSWLHFATFGARSTGGWAKPEGLYCVYDRYKNILDTPSFEVSFLKHEAQHVDDFQRFPGLPSKDLEYRAKLVELIYGGSYSLYERFVSSAKDDPAFPHSYAAFVLHKNMTLTKNATSEETREVAKKLYDEHTEQLLKLNHNYTEGII